ncbi:MAG: sodium-independent anion transporter, partial [Marinilabiliales bacterium]|nr:sodium-independent anion transporter [Marinilabiliales bacterium]
LRSVTALLLRLTQRHRQLSSAPEVSESEQRPLPEISIVHVEGSLFFGASELLRERVRRACEDPNLRIIILRLKNAHHLDASAILALEGLRPVHAREQPRLDRLRRARGCRSSARQTGLIDLIRPRQFFPESPQNPTLATRNALRLATGPRSEGGVRARVQRDEDETGRHVAADVSRRMGTFVRLVRHHGPVSLGRYDCSGSQREVAAGESRRGFAEGSSPNEPRRIGAAPSG